MRAPIGYFNVRKRDAQGREYRTIELDPLRAPLIKWAFEEYAKGDRAVLDLHAEITAPRPDDRADTAKAPAPGG